MENIARNLRLCTMCSQGRVEDLEHFILQCSHYEHTRHRLFKEVCDILPSFGQLSEEEKLSVICGGTAITVRQCDRTSIMRSSCLHVAFMYKVRVSVEKSKQR